MNEKIERPDFLIGDFAIIESEKNIYYVQVEYVVYDKEKQVWYYYFHGISNRYTIDQIAYPKKYFKP